jgi:hypothetical protein
MQLWISEDTCPLHYGGGGGLELSELSHIPLCPRVRSNQLSSKFVSQRPLFLVLVVSTAELRLVFLVTPTSIATKPV